MYEFNLLCAKVVDVAGDQRILMVRNDIFKLEDYQGKYHVKKLQVGTIIKTDK